VSAPAKTLTVIVCAAGPASRVGVLVALAQERGWTVRVVATPAALAFLDLTALESQTGSPVRSQYRRPDEPRSQPADAVIVAPATFNTINKWALGISDTYALGLLAEETGLGTPVVALPFVNTALAGRAPFRRAVEGLRGEGVRVLLGPGGFEPHPPRAGGEHIDSFPWHVALSETERCLTELAGKLRERYPMSGNSDG
jgi:phosphopantothenoylcysteine synthetase/decarboxylase